MPKRLDLTLHIAASFAALIAAQALAWTAGNTQGWYRRHDRPEYCDCTAMRSKWAHPATSQSGEQLLVATQKLVDEVWVEEFAPGFQRANTAKATAAALEAAEEFARDQRHP